MRFGRYLVLMASSWLLAAVIVLAFTLLVDPIGISPLRVAMAGFNASKPFRRDYDWIVKRYDVVRIQPTTIFMGSSRIKQSIDPRLLANTGFAPAYNGGINGSAAYGEIKSYLQYYLGVDSNLHHVFIEAFASVMLSYDRARHPEIRAPLDAAARARQGTATPQMRPEVVHFDRVADIADFASVFFSMSGLSSAVRTVSVNRRQRNSPLARSSDDGFAPVPLTSHHFSVRNVLNFVTYTGLLQRGGEVPPSIFDTASQMIAACEWYQVQCRFLVSPLHADVLFAMYHLGLWPELEKLKRGLAKLAPTYDFTRYNDIIDERIGPVVYWPEAFHFSPALGELVARAMTGLRTPDMPENFGVLLDPENMDANLAAWRQERDQWIARHPELAERMRKAEENFRNGVSFKAVTDAEIAAGGW
jgi:hypothetical protein